MNGSMHQIRQASITRETKETQIELSLDLDGQGRSRIDTGVKFLDHMLDALSRHSSFDITLTANGDAAMDPHHTVEDAGIVVGQGIRQALRDRAGIARYGFAYAPLDEALARTVVDCSGRPYLEYVGTMPESMIGSEFSSSLVEEFWRGLAMNAFLTIHIDLLRSRNAHHAAEAVFKSGAVALNAATRLTRDPSQVPSTKGVLA